MQNIQSHLPYQPGMKFLYFYTNFLLVVQIFITGASCVKSAISMIESIAVGSSSFIFMPSPWVSYLITSIVYLLYCIAAIFIRNALRNGKKGGYILNMVLMGLNLLLVLATAAWLNSTIKPLLYTYKSMYIACIPMILILIYFAKRYYLYDGKHRILCSEIRYCTRFDLLTLAADYRNSPWFSPNEKALIERFMLFSQKSAELSVEYGAKLKSLQRTISKTPGAAPKLQAEIDSLHHSRQRILEDITALQNSPECDALIGKIKAMIRNKKNTLYIDFSAPPRQTAMDFLIAPPSPDSALLLDVSAKLHTAYQDGILTRQEYEESLARVQAQQGSNPAPAVRFYEDKPAQSPAQTANDDHSAPAPFASENPPGKKPPLNSASIVIIILAVLICAAIITVAVLLSR